MRRAVAATAGTKALHKAGGLIEDNFKSRERALPPLARGLSPTGVGVSQQLAYVISKLATLARVRARNNTRLVLSGSILAENQIQGGRR